MRRLTYIQNLTRCFPVKPAVILISLASLSGVAHATDPIFQIDLNKTQILRLPEAAGSVVIGNPAIADVMLQSPTMILVIGRGFGETNLMVLDRNGDTVVDANVQVTSITPSNGVRLFNRGSRETYSCSPYCQPSPVLGDTAEHIDANSGQIPTNSASGSMIEQGLSEGQQASNSLSGAADLEGIFDADHNPIE